jgi:hypothetical protein
VFFEGWIAPMPQGNVSVEENRRAGIGQLADWIRLRKKSFAVIVAGSLVVVAAVAWPLIKAHLQAAAMLELVSGQKVPWIIDKLSTEPVRTQDLNFATEAGMVRGRLYLPERHRDAPGLVVLHGVHHTGIDEPRTITWIPALCG